VVGNFSARNARHGFLVFPDSTGLAVEGNVATANGGAGFATAPQTDVAAGVLLRGNAAVRNLGPGFLVDGTDLSLTGNAAIGNAVAGVEIAAESDAPLLSKNNFIGNGAPEGNGCGVLSSASSPVEARDSYWGAATGPGPRPADDACGGTAGVVAIPFATKPIKVKPKLPRID
jgi:nitrous oxidase accessory protein NosD